MVNNLGKKNKKFGLTKINKSLKNLKKCLEYKEKNSNFVSVFYYRYKITDKKGSVKRGYDFKKKHRADSGSDLKAAAPLFAFIGIFA